MWAHGAAGIKRNILYGFRTIRNNGYYNQVSRTANAFHKSWTCFKTICLHHRFSDSYCFQVRTFLVFWFGPHKHHYFALHIYIQVKLYSFFFLDSPRTIPRKKAFRFHVRGLFQLFTNKNSTKCDAAMPVQDRETLWKLYGICAPENGNYAIMRVILFRAIGPRPL